MKKIITLIITFAVTLSLSAQNWTKEMQKDFRKSKDVAVVVNLSKATIMGVSSVEFPDYYAGKYNTNSNYPAIILKKIKSTFENTFYETYHLTPKDPSKAKYVVHYDFNYISEYAGFKGICYVSCNGNNSVAYYFIWKDGRWNEFENLMMENIKRFFSMAKTFPNIIGGKMYEKK